MDFVVTADAFPLGRVHQRAVVDPAATVCGWQPVLGQRQGQATAHNPQPEFSRATGQELLYGAVPIGFLDAQLVGVASAKQAKVLWQQGQFSPLSGGLAQQHEGLVEVGLQSGARYHLQGSNFHLIASVMLGLLGLLGL